MKWCARREKRMTNTSDLALRPPAIDEAMERLWLKKAERPSQIVPLPTRRHVTVRPWTVPLGRALLSSDSGELTRRIDQ